MPKDKYTATWVSHTSISDFLKCPRAYFLKNIYKNPHTNHKVKLMTPPLALGQAVHEVVESLSILPTNDRFTESLMDKLDKAWNKVSGNLGGFADDLSEQKYKNLGKDMLRRVLNNPGPIAKRAVKIQQDLPYYWISEEDNIILCGKIDWLEYLPETDSVHIIDFKTGKHEEVGESLQLPIYLLLVHNCQQRKVDKASYWYLQRDDEPCEQTLPSLEAAHEAVLKIAKDVKLARQLKRFKCPHDGCGSCRPHEAIIEGKAQFVGVDDYKSDVYILPPSETKKEETSIIL